MRTWRSSSLLLSTGAAAVALRVVGLADYPILNPDEGFWTTGARNYVLFGDGLMDGRLHPFLSPGMFAAFTAWFHAVDPSLLSARALSVIAGLLTCGLVWVMSRRMSTVRSWLFPLFFGFSAFTIIGNRVALLEAHETFWLMLASFCWLRPVRGAAIAAGIAMGGAILVKSTAIYLIPAFFLTLPRSTGSAGERPDWKAGAAFLVTMAAIAGGGYFTAWSIDPASFSAAFRYELDGAHFADAGGVVFRVGRFGLHPERLAATFGQLARLDPVVLILSAAGLMMTARRWREATRVDRFFACWLVFGAAFHLSQIYLEVRYFFTMAPALAYLAAVSIEQALNPVHPRRALAVGALGAFLGFSVLRVANGVVRRPNESYWDVVSWFRDNAPSSAKVLASTGIGLSLPQRSYDFYRQLKPYSGPPVPLATVVERLQIRYLVFDGEWQFYANADTRQFIDQQTVSRATMGSTVIYELRTPFPLALR